MIVFFDLETRKLAADYGGDWGAFKADGGGGISALVTLSDADPLGSDPKVRSEVGLFDDSPESIAQAVALLEAADAIVSWNGKGFDLPVIAGLTGVKPFIQTHHDLCGILNKVSGRRWKLDDVAEHTLGRGKNGDALMAPSLAEDGRFGELFGYCLNDVELTRDLYYATLHEGVVLPNGRHLGPEEIWDIED